MKENNHKRSQQGTKERRHRTKRPKMLIGFIAILLFLPFAKYGLFCIQYSIGWNQPQELFHKVDLLSLLLMFPPFIIALGLYRIQKWGILSFFVYVFIFIAYNFYQTMLDPNKYNFSKLIFIQIYFFAVFYFMRENISAPFFNKLWRGWRSEKRRDIDVIIEINGKKFKTLDMSSGGMSVLWPKCPHKMKDEVQVIFFIGNEEFKSAAGLVRKIKDRVSFAFRRLDEKQRVRLKKAIRNYA